MSPATRRTRKAAAEAAAANKQEEEEKQPLVAATPTGMMDANIPQEAHHQVDSDDKNGAQEELEAAIGMETEADAVQLDLEEEDDDEEGGGGGEEDEEEEEKEEVEKQDEEQKLDEDAMEVQAAAASGEELEHEEERQEGGPNVNSGTEAQAELGNETEAVGGKDERTGDMAATSPTGGKIFIGGLTWDTTTEMLLDHFKKYGDITDSVIMKNRKTGHPRGFGFVTFADPSVCDQVLADTHVIDGRTVEAKQTVPRENMPAVSKGPKTKKIFVGGLTTSMTEEELKDYFSKFGKVIEHQIMQDHSTGRSRGFGFVTFESEQVVEGILTEGHMHELGGKQVEIKKAEPKRATQEPLTRRGVKGNSGYSFGRGDGYSPNMGFYGSFNGGYNSRAGGRAGGYPYSGAYSYGGVYAGGPYGYGDFDDAYGRSGYGYPSYDSSYGYGYASSYGSASGRGYGGSSVRYHPYGR